VIPERLAIRSASHAPYGNNDDREQRTLNLLVVGSTPTDRSILARRSLCIAQMGTHPVFFLHITAVPDNTNNVLALGFGVVVVCFVVLGSIWIMTHLDLSIACRCLWIS
jgi:heme/copper-type cytochrome/quinol oxidase subunit 4